MCFRLSSGLMYHIFLFYVFCCICISSVNAQAGLYDINFTLLDLIKREMMDV